MLKSTFALELDGQEAMMIISALQEQATQGSAFQRQMNTVLMQKIAKDKVKFHHDAYQIMASTYHLQVMQEHI
jgi:hypothetical protein